ERTVSVGLWPWPQFRAWRLTLRRAPIVAVGSARVYARFCVRSQGTGGTFSLGPKIISGRRCPSCDRRRSEHAGPLAALGGVDAGGQNVHVAEPAAGCRGGVTTSPSTRRAGSSLKPPVWPGET